MLLGLGREAQQYLRAPESSSQLAETHAFASAVFKVVKRVLTGP